MECNVCEIGAPLIDPEQLTALSAGQFTTSDAVLDYTVAHLPIVLLVHLTFALLLLAEAFQHGVGGEDTALHGLGGGRSEHPGQPE